MKTYTGRIYGAVRVCTPYIQMHPDRITRKGVYITTLRSQRVHPLRVHRLRAFHRCVIEKKKTPDLLAGCRCRVLRQTRSPSATSLTPDDGCPGPEQTAPHDVAPCISQRVIHTIRIRRSHVAPITDQDRRHWRMRRSFCDVDQKPFADPKGLSQP